jgi:hypothetical protein
MEPLQLFRFVEETIYELVLWCWLLPKTLARVVCDPAWVRPYVVGELAKAGPRYDDYMSPVLCLVLSGGLPLVGLVQQTGGLTEGPKPSPDMMVLIAALMSGLAPAIWSFAGVLADGHTITRSSLREEFHVQCLVFSPFYASLYLLFSFGIWLDQSRRMNAFLGLSILLALLAIPIWVLIAERIVWAHRHRAWRGFYLAIGSSILVTVVAWMIAVKIWPAPPDLIHSEEVPSCGQTVPVSRTRA